MNIAHVERHNGIFPFAGAVEVHTFNLAHLLHSIAREGLFVSMNLVHADSIDIVECHSQGVRADIVGRACFKFVGEFLVSGVFERYAANHFSTALIGRHLLQ